MLETFRKSEYTIKQILQENWDKFYIKHKELIRPVVVENVKKVMACGDKTILGHNKFTITLLTILSLMCELGV